MNTVMSENRHVKVLLTVRTSEFRRLDLPGPAVRVELNNVWTDADIGRIISSRLAKIARDKRLTAEKRDQLAAKLRKNGDGCILWVHMMLQSLEHSVRSNPKHLEALIDKAPAGLDSYYWRLLQVLQPAELDDRKAACIVLRLIVGAMRPLTLSEMSHAVTIAREHDSVEDVEEDTEPDMQEYLFRLVGPLLRIVDSKIYLVHNTVRDFLIRLVDLQVPEPVGSSGSIRETIRTFDCSLAQTHATLSRCCVSYLKLRDFRDQDLFPTIGFSTDELSALGGLYMDDSATSPGQCESPLVSQRNVNARYPFFRYAASYWGRHLASCQSTCDDALLQDSMSLSQEGTRIAHNWFEQYSLLPVWVPAEGYYAGYGDLLEPGHVRQLIVHSYFGHERIVSKMLEIGQPIVVADLRLSCVWAARMGHTSCFRLLVDRALSVEGFPDVLQAALHHASKRGHSDLVHSLCKQHSQINLNHRIDSYAPLEVAIQEAHFGVVKALLEHASPSAQYAIFETVPVRRAREVTEVHKVRLQILETLLDDTRFDFTLRNDRGRTALSLAAEGGCLESIDLLLGRTGCQSAGRIRGELLADTGDLNGC